MKKKNYQNNITEKLPTSIYTTLVKRSEQGSLNHERVKK